MTDQKPPRMFALTEQQLGALQEFFVNSPMPYKQSAPYVQMLTNLPEVNVLLAPEVPAMISGDALKDRHNGA